MDAILGTCIGIAAVLALLLGIRLGKGTAVAQSKAQTERIASQESEIARLSGLNATANEQNLQHRERIARAEEREIAQEQKYNQMKADLDETFKVRRLMRFAPIHNRFLTLRSWSWGARNQQQSKSSTPRNWQLRTSSIRSVLRSRASISRRATWRRSAPELTRRWRHSSQICSKRFPFRLKR